MNKEDLLEFFKPEIDNIDQAMRADITAIGNSHLHDVLEYALLNGGKRLRPLLAVFASRLRGNSLPDQENRLYRTTILFEYLHAASLLHDDVIDHADTRRGRPTANTVWGVTPVILAGDYLHTRAMHLAGRAGLECLDMVCRATSAMIESEFHQAHVAAVQSDAEADYFAVLHGKTGALIAAAAETGIYLSQGSDQERAAARVFGENLGLAFQVIDDLLDYLGDPAKTGKATGNDFQEGKMTLPLIYALQQANDAQNQKLRSYLASAPKERSAHFKEACALLLSTHAFDRCQEKAKELISLALRQLEIFPESHEKRIMTGLAQYILTRDK